MFSLCFLAAYHTKFAYLENRKKTEDQLNSQQCVFVQRKYLLARSLQRQQQSQVYSASNEHYQILRSLNLSNRSTKFL